MESEKQSKIQIIYDEKDLFHDNIKYLIKLLNYMKQTYDEVKIGCHPKPTEDTSFCDWNIISAHKKDIDKRLNNMQKLIRHKIKLFHVDNLHLE